MHPYAKYSTRRLPPWVIAAWLSLVVAGCHSLLFDTGYAERVEKVARAKARLPYYGTGVVTRLYTTPLGGPHARIDFAPFPPPSSYAELLIIRSNTLVGRVEVRTKIADQWGTRILEGNAQVGDLAIGAYHEKEFAGLATEATGGKKP